MKQRTRAALEVASLLALSLVSCGKDGGVTGPPPPNNAPSSVTLSQDTASVVPGASVGLVATVRDASGAVLSRPVTWTTSDNSRAVVTSAGLVTGVTAGSATITAMSESRSAQARVTIKEGAVVSPSGGSVSALQGRVDLTIPTGAVGAALMVTIEGAVNPPADARLVPGTAIELGPTGQSFTAPVQLRIRYDASQLPVGASEQQLRIHRAVGGSWQLVSGGQVDPATRTVSVSLMSFSGYAVLATGPPPAIALSAGNLAYDAVQGGANPPSQFITITNSGGGTLAGLSVGPITYGPGATGWLQPPNFSATTANPSATLTVQPVTGALTPGTYTATIPVQSGVASNSPQNVVVTLTVIQQPAITLSNSSLSYAGTPGGPNPPSQVITITNSGGGTLSGLSIGTISYGPGATGWLQPPSLSSTSASPSATVTVQPTTGALAPGTYTATIPVQSSVGSNSPRNITVTFSVSAAPAIALSTPSLSFNAVQGGSNPANQFITTTNGGGGTLSDLSIGTITYGPGATGWLDAPILSSTTANPSATLTVQPLTSALAAGTYTATIPLLSSVASNSPRNISVTLTVVSLPVIALSASSLTYNAIQGGANPPNQFITITNVGGGTLSDLSVGTITYGPGATGWLQPPSLSSTTATPSATLTVQPVTGALAPGTYTATIPVQSTVATNSPRNLTVTFTVVPLSPAIALSTSSLTYNATQGGANPANQFITITNSGGGTLSGLSTGAISYGAGATGWLQPPSLSSTTANPSATLTVQPVTGALTPGTYTATIPVQSAVATNSPRTLTVTFIVVAPAPAITLSTSSLAYAAVQGGANPASQFITITNGGGGTLSGLGIGTISYGAGATGWLQAPTLSSTTANPSASLTVQPVTGSLTPGTYTATIPVQSTVATNSPRNLTITFTVNSPPSGGPSNIVYERAGSTGPALKIWKMDPTGANQVQLSPSSTDFEGQPDISPDGTKIVFEATRSGNRGVYVMTANGTGAVQLFSLGASTFFNIFVSPRWSADGSMIAHDLPLNGNNDRYLRIMSSTGTFIRVLDGAVATARDFGPSWAPNGTELVARRLAKAENGTGRSDLVRLPAGGAVGTLLTGQPASHGEPVWSPTGNLVAFSATISGTSQIHLLNLTTSQITQLTNTGTNTSPTWSPDGTKIAFVRSTGAENDIWTMNLDGSNQTNLTNTAGINESKPDWGPQLPAVATPQISLAPTALTFNASQGGANPASQVTSITNSGGGTLSGLTIGTITYGPGATGWLQAPTLNTTTAPATLTIQPTTGTLGGGTYTATVPIQSAVATNSPQNLTVTFTVASATPSISLSTATLTYNATAGGANPASQFISITNGGAGTLSSLTLGTITYGPGAIGWLQVPTLSSTTAPATLSVQPVTGALNAGTYTATIPVQSAVASNSPQTLTVTFTVAAPNPACLAANAPAITPGAPINGILATTDCRMPVAGLSGDHYVDLHKLTLAATTTVTIDLTSTFDTFLSLLDFTTGAVIAENDDRVPGSDLNSQIVRSLAAGSYILRATSYSALTTGAYQLAVQAQAPTIALSPTNRTFNATQGGVNPASQFITITNGGTGTLSGLGTGTITYGAGASGWLQAPILSGTTANPSVTLTVQPVTGILTPGTYAATIPVTSGVASNSPQNLTVTFTVAAASSMSITSISPSPIVAGATGTITGTNFSTTPGDHTLSISGVSATITGSTTTTISFSVPNAAALPCQVTQAVPIALTRSGSSPANTTHPLSVASQRNLALGEALYLLTGSEMLCNQFTATGGEYLVTVLNTSTSPTSSAGFDLTGADGTLPIVASTLTPLPSPSTPAMALPPQLKSIVEATDARHRAHALALERNLDILRSGGSPIQALAQAHAQGAALASAVPQTVGTVFATRIPNFNSVNSCINTVPINARVVYVGTRSIIVEDVAAPLHGQMDATFTAMGQLFDNTQFGILTTNFGNPLAMDSQLDNDGKIVMVFSPVVSTFAGGGIAGFVSGCDFFPTSVFSGSNVGEYFYAIVPTTLSETNSQAGLPFWYASMRSAVIHEVKHITSFAERISRAGGGPPNFEESWLEEILARQSEELYARSYQGNAWKGNTNYASSVFCDVRRTSPQCSAWGGAYTMGGIWIGLYNYYRSQRTLSLFGPVFVGDFSFYQSGWAFMRWMVDSYAANEGTFLKAFVQDVSTRGLANVEARTGRPIAELVAKWSLAAFLDDVFGISANDPLLRVLSWNTQSIWQGLNTDFPANFQATPYVPFQSSYGNFLVRATVQGGSTAWTRISGTQSLPQLLKLSGQFGGALPSTVKLVIIRYR